MSAIEGFGSSVKTYRLCSIHIYTIILRKLCEIHLPDPKWSVRQVKVQEQYNQASWVVLWTSGTSKVGTLGLVNTSYTNIDSGRLSFVSRPFY